MESFYPLCKKRCCFLKNFHIVIRLFKSCFILSYKNETEEIESRLSMSERQKEIKEEFEKKELEEVQVAVKKRRIQAKQVGLSFV